MLLAKHVPGTPLSAAELRQRKNAARARWGWAIGAGTGAIVGAAIGGARRATLTSARAEAAADLSGIVRAQQLRTADLRVLAEAARRRRDLVAAIRLRQRANPETARERQHRLRDLLENPRTASARAPTTPVIGTPANLRIYDYELARLNTLLLRERRHLARLTRDAGGDTDRPDLRRQRARVTAAERDVDAMRQIQAAGPRTTARAGSTRGQATTEQKFRRGETQRQIRARIAHAKTQLNARQRTLLDLLDARTMVARQIAHDRVIEQSTAAVRSAFEHGEYQSRILRASGRGGLLGAGIGLTTVGIGILAHHLATHGIGKGKPLRKLASLRPELAKARRATPEDQMGVGLGMTFRRWIDRLLGKNTEPMNLGDGIAEALAPGIVQAFAEGARDPPIARGESDPRSWIEVDFDQLNPSVRRHMAEYALDRIVELTDAQRAAIRDALMKQSVLRGIGPYDVARTIRQSIGLTAYQQSVVESFRVGLEQLDPRVLERKLRDRRYDSVLQTAIDNNEPLTAEQIMAMTDAYHRRMLALRSRTIARTEALRATSYGGLARAQEVLDEHPELDVTKRWLATKDERTRDTHRDLDGREVEGMTTQFVSSKGNPIRWPLDDKAAADEVINCRCTLQYVFHAKRGQLQAVAV